jgi:hypothetical protein
LCVLEEAAASDVALPPAFELLDERRVGDSKVLFLRFGSGAPA